MCPPNGGPDFYCEPYNLSVAGHTILDVQTRMTSEIKSRQDSETNQERLEIIFALGVNDSITMVQEKRPRVDDDLFQRQARTLFESAAKLTDRISCIGLLPVNEPVVTPMPWSPQEAYTNARIKDFERVLLELCKIQNIRFLPLFDAASSCQNWGSLLYDGVHPNTQGHAWIADQTAPFLIGPDFIEYHSTD